MFYALKYLINKLEERALRIVHNDYNSSFFELLEVANENAIHIRNSKFLLAEIYKFLNGLSPPIMNEVFQTNGSFYHLRNPRILASKHKSTIKYAMDTIVFKSPQTWQKVPLEIRNLESLKTEYKTEAELALPLQNLSFIHS